MKSGMPGWKYKESKPPNAPAEKPPLYKWKKPIPFAMNIYVLDEEDVLLMLLKDRRIKETAKITAQ